MVKPRDEIERVAMLRRYLFYMFMAETEQSVAGVAFWKREAEDLGWTE